MKNCLERKILIFLAVLLLMSSNLWSWSLFKKKKKTEGPTTIRFAWWTNQARTTRTLNAIKIYEELNQNVKIEAEYQGWGQYWDKLATQIAANDLPDIIQQDLLYLTQYSDKKLIIPLDRVKGLDLSAMDKSALELGKLNGKLMGATVGTNAIALVYDADIFKEAGVNPPTVKWTWDDYKDAAIKIHEKLGIYGADYIEVPNILPLFLRSKGKALYSADGKKLGYNDDKLFIEFLNIMKELQEKGAMPKPDYWIQVQANEAGQYISTGKAAMGFTWAPGKISEIYKTKGKAMDLMVIPGNNDKGMYLKPSMYFSITSSCKDVESAAKFMSWLVTNDEAIAALEGDRGVPTTPGGRKILSPNLSEQDKKVYDYIDLVAKHSAPLDPPYPAAAGEIRDMLTNIFADALFGKYTPEEAAAKFRKDAEEALAR